MIPYYFTWKEGIAMAVCSNLKDIREQHHQSQEDVANATGACSRTIGRYERGERKPSLEMALRLARYFEVPVEELFSLEEGW